MLYGTPYLVPQIGSSPLSEQGTGRADYVCVSLSGYGPVPPVVHMHENLVFRFFKERESLPSRRSCLGRWHIFTLVLGRDRAHHVLT